ncbi:MAG: SAM-dependent methyltransferase [Rhodobacteraceae bacterium PARR1]|nr:MAG: SAM-dependent methyltransferase [Rhodobacteraceae bacterium PARR1]
MGSVDDFISRWRASSGSERANFQQFAIELTQVLGVDAPKPATSDAQNDHYRFERPVTFIHTSSQTRGFIDLYRRGCFVMEAKQGVDAPVENPDQPSFLSDLPAASRQGHGQRGSRKWDDTMLRARNQADSYARAVSRADGWPPFLLVVDVGHVIEVHADFSGQGQGYTQFPDGNRYRITLDDLREEGKRTLLRAIWTNPLSLDPSKVSAQVTRKVASHLAELGKSFEGQGHAPEAVAKFLMRCLFTMFAEDVRLIPEHSFKDLLQELRGRPQDAKDMLEGLFREMDAGGMSHVLRKRIPRFNGGLFANATALPVNEVQLSLLINAAGHDWREVEPAIFGTLLERALDVRQRHKLGAHYTPRAYVERLVNPTVIQPLRTEWETVQATALTQAKLGQEDAAKDTVRAFHRRLCEVRVLDPACGSGNFLYVALELMKRLEGEIIALLRDLRDDQAALALAGHTVDPHQFLGIEVNPWAAAVAELVLWIGYLQWHFRTHGTASPAEPVLRDFHNIENRDAVLDWDDRRPRKDEHGNPVTRWDGITTITHPVTGEAVPDPQARVQVWDYLKPRPAKWPDAEFIVGNPPFIGNKRMRDTLGDGYTEAIRKAYPKVPDSADFVMFWWEKAALAARAYKGGKGCRRFGFITTNSLRQTFNRRVLETHLNDPKTPLGLVFAIPDHPWVDSGDGAAVRIAMTVAEKGRITGRLLTVNDESKFLEGAEGRAVNLTETQGTIQSDLTVGAAVASTLPLRSNRRIAYQGVIPGGDGFYVTYLEAHDLYRREIEAKVIRRYLNGREFIEGAPPRFIIDFTGMTLEEVRDFSPALFQRVLDTVKPVRDAVKRQTRRERWWIYSEPNVTMRPMFDGLDRYIVTCRTAKHRLFGFLDVDILPDAKLIAIGLDDAAALSVLSSRFHVTWSDAAGGWLGVGNDSNYNHAQCFNPFPFPDASEAQKATLRALGEELDAHRKDRQKAHPKLTLTAMYNVLEKLRAGERIEGKDKEVYDQGLIGLLKDIHDRIDAAVAAAYGWPLSLSDDDILLRLVALNRERAVEEARGIVRWLRPDYQNPAGQTTTVKGEQTAMDIITPDSATRSPWPKTLPEQMAAVREALSELREASPEQVARHFARARTASVTPLLESLSMLGYAQKTDDGRYAM